MLLIVALFLVKIIGATKQPLDLAQVSKNTSPVLNGPQQYLGEQLNDLSSQLAHIEHQLSSQTSVVDLDPLRSQLSEVSQQAHVLAGESQKLISDQIKVSTQSLEKQLSGISQQLNVLKEEKKQTTYLKYDHLPFRVLHIDNIQETNVVTVSYDNRTFPMDVGDYLVEWKLISADFVSQKVEFINDKEQHVVVDLNRLD